MNRPMSRLLAAVLSALWMTSCGKTSSLSSSSPLPSVLPSPEASSSSSSEEKGIPVHAYVSGVADTAPILLSGSYEGEDVGYVVTSEPVLFAARQKKSSLSVYSNVSAEFGKKFGTDGFPQAGLFLRKSLALDASKKADIEDFLSAFDADVKDLVEGATEASQRIDAYSSDPSKQKARFGFTSSVLKGVQANNGLAFLPKEKNPDLTGFAKFKAPLGIDVREGDLSAFYSETLPSSAKAPESLSFSVASPSGAPAAAFSRYASDTTHFVTGAPANVMAEFAKATSDFIVFDSVNGLKLSAKNGSKYQLVRMVTFGNLYLVSTGKDVDGKLSPSDKVVSYGENLVPDLVFKAVYGE